MRKLKNKSKHFMLWVILTFLGLEVIMCLILNWLRPEAAGDANRQYLGGRLLKPFTSGYLLKKENTFFFTKDSDYEYIKSDNPPHRKIFWLGTDSAGRDYLDRLLGGLRISLFVGCMAMLVSFILGSILGAIAGFWGGFSDKIITWFVQVLWTFPSVFLALTISLLIGKGLPALILAIGLSQWTDTARIIRSEVMRWKSELFVEASRSLGYSKIRQLVIHIFPNIWPVAIITTVSQFSTAILLESGLSFLGLGIDPPKPSLGNLVSENKIFLFGTHMQLVILPALLLIINTLALILLSNKLRDKLDVKLSKS